MSILQFLNAWTDKFSAHADFWGTADEDTKPCVFIVIPETLRANKGFLLRGLLNHTMPRNDVIHATHRQCSLEMKEVLDVVKYGPRCSSMCHAPVVIQRLATGRPIRGVDTVSLSVLTSCGQKLTHYDPYESVVLQNASPRSNMPECLVCMINAATHQFSGCYHPEPQLCTSCASKITRRHAKPGLEHRVDKAKCFLCRKPGYIVKMKKK